MVLKVDEIANEFEYGIDNYIQKMIWKDTIDLNGILIDCKIQFEDEDTISDRTIKVRFMIIQVRGFNDID